MMTENSSIRTDRVNAGRSRSGFLGAIFGIGKKKGCEKERIRPTDPKRPSTSILEKNTRRADGASKKSRASTPDDSLYSFMMAKHGRLGAYSAASQVMEEVCRGMIDFKLALILLLPYSYNVLIPWTILLFTDTPPASR
jgi:hypothetical protein